MTVLRRLESWAGRVNPGLAAVAVVLGVVDASVMVARQVAPADRATERAAGIVAERDRPAVASAAIGHARPSLREIYATP
jgi:hypothetical protein